MKELIEYLNDDEENKFYLIYNHVNDNYDVTLHGLTLINCDEICEQLNELLLKVKREGAGKGDDSHSEGAADY